MLALILKPPSGSYPELPENEDLIMRLAALRGIPVELRAEMPFAAVALIASVLARP